MKTIILTSVMLIKLATCSAQKFACPMHNGRLIIYQQKRADYGIPAREAYYSGDDSNVYSSAKGNVSNIDSSQGAYVLYIKYGNYTFGYHNLGQVNVKKGSVLRKQQLIGALIPGKNLYIIITKNGLVLMPSDVIKCKAANQVIDE